MNKEHILKIADAIENRHTLFGGTVGFNMGDFVHEVREADRENDTHLDPRLPECGTTACIAGWSNIIRTGEVNPVFCESFDWGPEAIAMGLTLREADKLFYSTSLTDVQAVGVLRRIASGESVDDAIWKAMNDPKGDRFD